MSVNNQEPEIQLRTAGKPLSDKWSNLRLITIVGVPVFLNWTFFVGAFPIAVFTGFDLEMARNYCLAYTALIVLHELGHVLAARSLNLKVHSVHMTLLGGHCLFQRPNGARQTLIIYAAGLVVQVLLLVLTVLWFLVLGPPETPWTRSVFNTFVFVNIGLMLLILVPLELGNGVRSDGSILWQLLMHVLKGVPQPFPNLHLASTVFAPETSLENMPSMVPPGFTTGIEFLNDDTTPMEFVVVVLAQYLLLERERAIEMMLKVHGEGGMLIPVEGLEASQAIAKAICADAAAKGYALVCRAIDLRVPSI